MKSHDLTEQPPEQIRVVHATGNALVITATFTFTAVEFQNSVGKIFSWTRTAMNVAQGRNSIEFEQGPDVID